MLKKTKRMFGGVVLIGAGMVFAFESGVALSLGYVALSVVGLAAGAFTGAVGVFALFARS